MINISKEMASEYAEYCDALQRAAFNSGKNDSSIWFKNAKIEQIKELLSKDFSKYAQYNDITFLYRGVEEEIKKAGISDWKAILETKSGSFEDPCYYVLLNLMLEYHDGLKYGVGEKLRKVANKFFNFDDDDNDNDDNDDDDNNDDDC